MQIFDTEKIELVKQIVKEGKLPQFVYKYYKLNNFTEDVLRESKIWFGSPVNFNDPFDCQLIPDTKNNKKEIELYLKDNATSLNRENRKRKSDELNKNPAEWRKIISSSLEKISSKSGITSFCGSNDNILMWSHYSDSHKGICLKFDILKSPETFVYPTKVNYSTRYPIFNYLKNTEEILKFLFLTKAKCWEYEQELRVIKTEVGKYDFSSTSLVEVTFGCRTDKKDIEKYKKILLNKKYDADLKIAIPSSTNFNLEIKSCN